MAKVLTDKQQDLSNIMTLSKSTDKQKKEHRGAKNLIPFKPGRSGNPKGRPKKEKCIPDILNKLGDIIVKTEEGNKITQRELILLQVYGKALGGDQWSIQFIADRTEGKPFITQNINFGNEESPYAQFTRELADEVKKLEAKN